MQQHDGNNPVERAVGIGYDAGEGGHQQPPPGLCGQPAHLSGSARVMFEYLVANATPFGYVEDRGW